MSGLINKIRSMQPQQNDWGSLERFAQDRLGGADMQRGDVRNRFMGAIGSMAAFDPAEAMRTQAQSMYSDMSGQFRAAEAQRRAALNRRGLLGSDVGGARGQRDFHDSFSRALAGLSMQGAQMRQQNLGNVANAYGGLYDSDTNQSNMFADMLYGARASGIQQRFAEQQARSQRRSGMFGSILGAIGTIGGAALGGPVGAAIGGRLGGMVGGKLGGGAQRPEIPQAPTGRYY